MGRFAAWAGDLFLHVLRVEALCVCSNKSVSCSKTIECGMCEMGELSSLQGLVACRVGVLIAVGSISCALSYVEGRMRVSIWWFSECSSVG